MTIADDKSNGHGLSYGPAQSKKSGSNYALNPITDHDPGNFPGCGAHAGDRQVKDARYGLTHNLGGTGATAVVHIMEAV